MSMRWNLLLREVQMAFKFMHIVLVAAHFTSHDIVTVTNTVNVNDLHLQKHHITLK